jgi:hypothetical protein
VDCISLTKEKGDHVNPTAEDFALIKEIIADKSHHLAANVQRPAYERLIELGWINGPHLDNGDFVACPTQKGVEAAKLAVRNEL